MKTLLAWNLNSVAESAIAPQDGVVPRLCHFAQILLEKHEFAAALDQFDLVIQRQPNYSPAWMGRTQALVSLGRHTAALASLEKVAVLLGYPQANLLLMQAQLLCRLDLPQRALSCCDSILAIAPNHLRARMLRALILLRLGRPGDIFSKQPQPALEIG